MNLRGAFLHMAADAAVSLGVVVAGFAMARSGRLWIDPVVSLAIAAVIVWGTWGLLRDSLWLAMDAVPPGVDLAEVQSYLGSLPGIAAVHDLHIWAMSTTETALTVHLVKPGSTGGDDLLRQIDRELRARFGIEHATIQMELGEGPPCHRAPENVV